jgi:DNA primase
MCFECGYIADQIRMRMDWGCCTYTEAVNEHLPYTEVLGDLQVIAHSQLLFGHNREPIQYLIEQRKVPIQTIRKYGLGYVDPSDERTKEFILKNRQILKDLKLFYTDWSMNDRLIYENQIIFPVLSWVDFNSVIGFASRNYEYKRFMHSPNNAVYSKKNVLYGKSNEKELSRAREVFVVEGMFDVHAMEKIVDRPVFGLIGGKSSNGFLALHRYGVKKLIIATDNDEAGQAAFDSINQKWSSLFVIDRYELPKGMDPDQYVNSL